MENLENTGRCLKKITHVLIIQGHPLSSSMYFLLKRRFKKEFNVEPYQRSLECKIPEIQRQIIKAKTNLKQEG